MLAFFHGQVAKRVNDEHVIGEREKSGMSNSKCTNLRHATVDNEILTVDEAALFACQEQDCICLLNCFSKSTTWEVYLTTVSLLFIVAEPIL